MKYKQKIRKIVSIFMVFSLILTMFNGVVLKNNGTARATDIVDITQIGGAQVHQEGCNLVIKKTQETEWVVPRKPIDLVILQDASGSFKDTIGGVKSALKTLTTPVKQTEYDPDHPRLVFTNTPETSDRVMVASFQGLDGYRVYDDYTSFSYNYNGYTYTTKTYTSDSNFTGNSEYGNWSNNPGYKVESSNLVSDVSQINSFIDNIATEGGTPTVPAIEKVIKDYKDKVAASQAQMKNGRKTVFLLVTDGVANGVVDENGKVVIEYSGWRSDRLRKAWGLNAAWSRMEASQNYLKRAEELREAGKKLKTELGDNGSVVVGFWEDIKGFTGYGHYGTTYLNGFENTDVDTGDNRSVQAVFSEVLRGIATPDKEVNGKPATFYVNEQNDIDAFAEKVLAAVGNALVKEDVKGKFKVTDGYRVKSVAINDKQVVDTVTDKNTQIRGKITQKGNDVEISVPDAAFNPGKNKFDYELTKTEEAPELDEEDEVAPADNYTPGKVERVVGELVGRFSVGDYQTAEIGSKGETKVTVNELKYCYPNVTKSITDQDKSNDTGSITDPILPKRMAYGANLSNVHEPFEYTVEYRMNNIPLNMQKNPMLVDPVNYRLKVLDAYVTDESGQKRTDFNIRYKTGKDSQTGKEYTTVVADIPMAAGINSETVKEGQYGAHKFKKYKLHVKTRFKDEYPFETNQSDYIKILQENDGLGPLNQAFIKWNGESNDPDDSTAQVRRSNNVFVVPPVETNIEKKVRGENEDVVAGKEHYDLPLRDDKFIYDIKSGWPGLAKSYVLEDTLKDELEIVKDSNNSTKHDVNVLVNGKPISQLQKFLKVEGNKVKLELQEKDIDRRVNTAINIANRGNLGPALIHIQIKAKIRDGANLDKYRDNNGVIKIPNVSTVTLNGKPKESNVVTVTPNEPAVAKKINDTLNHLDIASWDKKDNAYNYNVKTTLPDNIRDYGTYRIEDTLDKDLELQEGQQPYIKGSAADHFDVSYDEASRKVTATLKDGHFGQIEGKSVVELVIPAKIKAGVTREKIPNTAKIIYNKANATGEPKELETPPVTVTPPPSTPTKKINDTLDDLVIPTAEENAYNYNIKTKLPGNIHEYKVFGIKDVLDKRLELQSGKDSYIKGENSKHFDVTYDQDSNTVIAKVKDGHFDQLKGGEEVELVIPAKIKDDVTDSKIPNTATVIYNTSEVGGTPKETPPTPPVTVTPPPKTPDITKTVNDKQHDQLANIKDEFTYKIDTVIPKNATAFKVTDQLESVLDFSGDVTVKVDNKDVTAEVTKQDGLLTVNLPKDVVENNSDKSLHIEFKAKIKEGADLSKYVDKADGKEKVPNKAKFTINDNPKLEKETPPVTVTPPPSTPGITKKVNDKEHVDLQSQNEVFTYKVETTVPKNASKFEVSDTIKDVLAFEGEVKATVDGETITDVTKDGQKLTVKLSEEQVKTKTGKAVVIEFKAKLKDGVTEDELKPYISEETKTVRVPNTAEYKIDLGDKPELKKETPPVTVTPPPSEPGIKKTVNDKEHHQLSASDEEFTYKIDTTVPKNATAFKVTDELEKVLEFSGEVTATVDGKAIAKEQIKVNGQTLTVELNKDEIANNVEKAVHIEFKAKVKKDADLKDYIEASVTKVPNKAKYTINNNPKFEKETPPVTVTPPPSEPGIKKAVNGKEHADLNAGDEVFTYKVETEVPTNATEFSVSDTIEEVLAFEGDVKATVDGEAITDVTKDGQKLTVKLSEEQARKAGKAVVVEFQAKIKDGADLSKYVDNNVIKVPNKATYKVNNKPEKESNTVTVTPPPTKPDIKKSVNGKLSEQLKSLDEEFTYTIQTKVPKNITVFKVFDTLESVLEFSGEVTATLDGKAIAKEQIKVDGQTLTVELTQDQVLANGDKEVRIDFKSKIRKGADLSAYIVKDLSPSIPNQAKYRINNNPGLDKDSNIVPVTPPSITPPQPGQKSVNSEKGEEKDTVRMLKTYGEIFRYDIEAEFAKDAYYKQFSITDEVEKVLNPFKATVRISGDEIDEDKVLPELKSLKDKLKKLEAELKELSVDNTDNKVDNKVDLSKLEVAIETAKADVAKAEKAVADSKAKYDLIQDKETPEAKALETEKAKLEAALVEVQAKLTKANTDLQTAKAEANKPATDNKAEKAKLEKSIKEVEDKVKEAENTDKAKAIKLVNEALKSRNTKGEISDELAKKLGHLEIKDNKVIFEITDRAILRELEGRKVTLSIYANIKDGADLTPYVKNGATLIPNKAVVSFDNRPKVTNTVYVVPPKPTPPTPSTPPTPPTPPTPDKPKPVPPKKDVPKKLPNTGEQTNNLEWLGVLGVSLLLLRRKFFNDNKE